jgi:hypothetical protein
MSFRTDILTESEAQTLLEEISQLLEKNSEVTIDTPAILTQRLSLTVPSVQIFVRRGDYVLETNGTSSLFINLSSSLGSIVVETPRTKLIEEVLPQESIPEDQWPKVSTEISYVDIQSVRISEGIAIFAETTTTIKYTGTGSRGHIILGPISL